MTPNLHQMLFVAAPFPPVPRRAWQVVGGLQALLVLVALQLPGQQALFALIPALVVMIASAIWRHFQHDVLPGILAQFAYTMGSISLVTGGFLGLLTSQLASNLSDGFLLAGYLILSYSAARTGQLRGDRDVASWLDAGIFAVAFAAPLWAFWLAPTGATTRSILFAAAFLVLLAAGARMVAGAGQWTLAELSSCASGVLAGLVQFLMDGPVALDAPPWFVAAPVLILSVVTFLVPATSGIYQRGIRPDGMSINLRLGMLAASVTVPMSVLAIGFVQGGEIQSGVYALVFALTSVAVAIRVEMTRRAGQAIWLPGALAACATLALFAVTGVLAALGENAESRRREAAALSDVVIALQPLDGLMVRTAAAPDDSPKELAARRVYDEQLGAAEAAVDGLAGAPGTRGVARGIADDLQAYVAAAGRELDGGVRDAGTAAAYARVISSAEAATLQAREDAADRARESRTVTVLLSGTTLVLIAGLLLAYGAMQRRAEIAAREAHDELTGLASRTALLQHIEQLLRGDRVGGTGEHVAVVSVDIVDGRRFSDSLGDADYEELLRSVAGRLLTVVRDDDIVARPRNDGFAIALCGRAIDVEATVVAQRIVGAFVDPVTVHGRNHLVAVSIGIAFASEQSGEEARVRAKQVLRNGDLAAGEGGRSDHGIRVFAPEMEAAARERIELAAELRRAIEQGELRLFYQPLVDLATGLPSGYEALMRWQHPTRGLVSPGVFIPIAERAGLISDLGGWALNEACRQMAAWQANWGDVRYISVNVAAAQLRDGILLEQLHEALESSGLPPSQLQLEVTESSLMEDVDAADRIMRQVQMMGMRWALDDFGTGYSSLSYLRRFPVQVLKIDKSFVDDITDDETGGPLVAGIIDMARNLRMTVVAEGIEDAEQGARVRAMGGDVGQGFLFSRPLPPEQVQAFGRSTVLPQMPAGQSGHLRIAR